MSTLQDVPVLEEQKAEMQAFRDKFEALFTELKVRPASRGWSYNKEELYRQMNLCLTKFEESAMWLNKATPHHPI